MLQLNFPPNSIVDSFPPLTITAHPSAARKRLTGHARNGHTVPVRR
jgi:hypothetical protein